MIHYTDKEKDVLYQLQLILSTTPNMSEQLLRHIINKLSPDQPDPKEFSLGKIEGRVTNWWMYLGQWDFPMWSCSRKYSEKLADALIHKNEKWGNLTKVHWQGDRFKIVDTWPDYLIDGFVILSDDLFIQIRNWYGKLSLWPMIYPLGGFYSIGDFLNYHKNEDYQSTTSDIEICVKKEGGEK